jgi:hypothetical protein
VLTSEATQFADGLDATTFINSTHPSGGHGARHLGRLDAECDPDAGATT